MSESPSREDQLSAYRRVMWMYRWGTRSMLVLLVLVVLKALNLFPPRLDWAVDLGIALVAFTQPIIVHYGMKLVRRNHVAARDRWISEFRAKAAKAAKGDCWRRPPT